MNTHNHSAQQGLRASLWKGNFVLSIGWKQLVVQGVLLIIFGVMTFIWTGAMSLSLIVLWGAFAFVDGITQLVAAFGTKTSGGLKALYIIGGIFSIIAGLIALFRPILSGVALAWVIGIWLIARAIIEVYAAFAVDSGSDRWWRLLGAVFYGIVGIFIVGNPAAGFVTLVIYIGISALFAGIFFLIAGLRARKAVNELAA